MAYLLRLGADIDHSDDSGFSALHHAARRGYVDTVDVLVQAGANIEAQSLDCGTPLHLAALEGHAEVLRYLLEHRADANAPSQLLGRPLHCSCFHGSLACTDALLAAGADPAATVRVQFEKLNDITFEDRGIETDRILECQPLIVATSQQHTGLFDALLHAGASIEATFAGREASDSSKFVRNGLTALHLAVIDQSPECCLALLRRKANVNVENVRGETPLILACKHTKPECLEPLLQFGPCLDLTDKIGVCALSWAVRASGSGSLDPARLLIQHGASLDWLGLRGRSLLHVAVEHGSVEMTAFLLDSGAPSGLKHDRRGTPLELARRMGGYEGEGEDVDEDENEGEGENARELDIKVRLLAKAEESRQHNFLELARTWMKEGDV